MSKIYGDSGADRVVDKSIHLVDLSKEVLDLINQFAQPVVDVSYTGTTVNSLTKVPLTINVKNAGDDGLVNPTTGVFRPTMAGWYLLTFSVGNPGVSITGLVAYLTRRGGSGDLVVAGSSPGSSSAEHWAASTGSAIIYFNGADDQAVLEGYCHAGSFTATGRLQAMRMSNAVKIDNTPIVSPPKFVAVSPAAQNFPDSTATVIALNAIHDSENWFANNKFTPKKSGWYQLNAEVLTAHAGSPVEVTGWFAKNGAITLRLNSVVGLFNPGTRIAGGGLVYLNGTTDFVELVMFIHATSPGISGNGGTESTFMSGFWVGD